MGELGGERARWAAAVRGRVEGSAGPYGLLGEDALTEAVELFRHTARTADIVETCHLVGRLHWQRAVARADEAAVPEMRTAAALLTLVALWAPALPVPEPVRRSCGAAPGGPYAPQRTPTWDDLLHVLALRLDDGADAHTARLAIGAARQAVAQGGQGGQGGDGSGVAGRLRVLGIGWQRLYEHTGEPAAIEQAVAVARRAVRHADPGVDRAMSLHNLAEALRARYGGGGDLAVLQEAVDAGRAAVREEAGAGEGGGKRYIALGGLADSLRMLYERTGAPALLDEALRLSDAALAAVPGDADVPAAVLVNATVLLRHRFERTGDPGDLEEAIRVMRRAVAAAPHGTPTRLAALYNLGGMLHTLAARTGDLTALDEALAVADTVVRATPAEHPDGPRYRATLVGMLTERHDRTGDPEALDRAVTVAGEALAATPREHPERWMHLANLAVVLKTRARLTGDVDGVRAALGHEREMARIGHDAAALTNLGNTLRLYHDLTGDADALAEAVAVGRDAVAGTAEDHLARATCEVNLALTLRTAGGAHAAEATALLRAAASRASAPTEVRVGAAREWGELAMAAGRPGEAADAFALGVGLLPRLAARGLLRTDAARWLAGHSRLASDAAACALAAGRPEQAVEMLEMGRGVLLAQALESRTDLTELREREPALADRFDQLCTRLDASTAGSAGPYAAATAGSVGPYAAAMAGAVGPHAAAAAGAVGPYAAAAAGAVGPYAASTAGPVGSHAASTAGPVGSHAASTTGTAGPHAAPIADNAGPHADDQDPDLRRRLAHELDALLERVRALPGLEGFLLPPPAARLAAEAHSGPVVMVNVSRYRSDALILTPHGTVDVCALPGLDPGTVHDRLTDLRAALDDGAEDDAALAEDLLPWLWDTVAEPVLDRLGLTGPLPAHPADAPRLWWIPCGPLAHFPLHAAGRHLQTPRRTVMDRVVSSYAPTVRALAHARARQSGGERSGRRPRMLAVAMPETPGQADLPGARAELARLARFFPEAERLVGADATCRAVLDRLPGHPWAHFACHAGADPEDPYRSRLLVHDHASEPLSVRAVSRLRLADPEFAYLSACGTAVTRRDLADEALHVVTAFQLAGFPQVVGALWQVNDAVAVEIADRVYAHLAATGYDATRTGACVHAALRMVRDRYPAYPRVWAAHLHMGA
ncbi:CHAT domain-containing protein [Streptomyces flavalbus]|uniref:CHAT domain-containing protein n=1 Tax=Streptomyces flavalbus TaxID=2665155 RepID=A0ABW2WC04_9ACTN